VEVLANLGDEPTATLLHAALDRKTAIVALTIEDRERILRALDDPPERLAELRGVCSPSVRGGYGTGSCNRAGDGGFGLPQEGIPHSCPAGVSKSSTRTATTRSMPLGSTLLRPSATRSVVKANCGESRPERTENR
jgi:hypothetical protein